MVQLGLEYTENFKVQKEHLAVSLQSGTLKVLGSPALISFLEKVSWMCVQPYLIKTQSTVGTYVEFNHLAPTPLGSTIFCKAELIAINNKELTFKVLAFENDNLIAQGLHKRFIVDRDKFQQKADLKLTDTTKK